METQEFDLAEFRNYLIQLEKELSKGVSESKDYDGEIDDVIASLKRLTKELKDEKYAEVLPDLFSVLNFLSMIEQDFDGEDEDEDDDFEDDEDDFDDEDFDEEDEDEDEEFEDDDSDER